MEKTRPPDGGRVQIFAFRSFPGSRLIISGLEVRSADKWRCGEVVSQTERHRTVFECKAFALNAKYVEVADLDIRKLEIAEHICQRLAAFGSVGVLQNNTDILQGPAIIILYLA